MGYSGFEIFPKDFDTLKCLKYCAFSQYFRKINLSEIDISKNPCLEGITFQTYTKNVFSGIPTGLDSSKYVKVYVNYYELSAENKKILKNYNKAILKLKSN